MSSNVLDSLVKVSNNLNCRDKSVKILQYGSRLISGYYGSVLKKENLETVTSTIATCSLARRSFRVFKSINHIQVLLTKLNKLATRDLSLSVQDRQYVLQCVEAFEQLFWALFFLNDNIILGIKLGVLKLDVTRYEGVCFPCWFAADVSIFTKTMISLYGHYQSKREIKNDMNALKRLGEGLDGSTYNTGSGTGTRFLCSTLPLPPHLSVGASNRSGKNASGSGKDELSSATGNSGNDVAVCCENQESEMKSSDIVKTGADTLKTDVDNDHSNVTEGIHTNHLNINDFQDMTLETILRSNSNANISSMLNTDRSLKAVFIAGGSASGGSGSGSGSRSGSVTESPVKVSTGTYADVVAGSDNNSGSGSGSSGKGDITATDNTATGDDQYHMDVGCVDYNVKHRNGENSRSGSGASNDRENNNENENDVEGTRGEEAEETTDCTDISTNSTDNENNVDTNSIQGGMGLSDSDFSNGQIKYETQNATHSLQSKLQLLNKAEGKLYFKLVKSIIDMGVSGSFNPRLPIKKIIGEGGLGLLGVLSAAMAIYEEVQNK